MPAPGSHRQVSHSFSRFADSIIIRSSEVVPHRVLVVDDPHSRDHHPPDWHPESVARLAAVQRGISQVDGIETVASRAASQEELELVHEPALIARVQELSEAGGGSIDSDTFVSAGTYDAACFAAGAGLVAIDRLLADPTFGSGFVVTRPPGHHATRGQAMGFCFFNNIAIAAAYLLGLGARVAIVDWDVHHGNGTQEIFWNEDRVLYVSIHQEAHYPGTGHPHERGPAPENITTVNLPLPAGATGDHYLALFDDVAGPLVSGFEPDWVLVSCGFDAHVNDLLADMALEAVDFALFTDRIASWSPSGRSIFFLEGGYDLAALEESTAAVLSVLTGAPIENARPTTGGPGAGRVSALRHFWEPDRE